MKIRPQTFVAGMTGKVTPMNNVGAKGFYIQSVGGRWWIHRKGVVVANLPYTIESPHPGQMQTRVHFGRIASQTAGMPLAERLQVIAERMRGYRASLRMNPDEYPSKVRRSYHTLAQLQAMLNKRMAQGGRATATAREEEALARAGRFFEGGL